MDSKADFTAPHPGSQAMPPWTTGELTEAPRIGWRNLLALIGPGLVMSASAIGGGEWLVGPTVTARYGGAMLWLATLSIVFQALYNIEVCRYTLYCGEPIFTGKLRTLPGPMFWLWVYLLLDSSVIFSYLAAGAATPIQVILLGGEMPKPDAVASHWWMAKIIATTIFLLSLVPLIFGGKIFNSLKVVMTSKLVIVFGFLLVLAVFYSRQATWIEIGSGFFAFGNVPVQKPEDANANGRLDPGEDWDGDFNLDVVEERVPPSIDTNGDGKPEDWETDDLGKPIKHIDVDGDGVRDGDNVRNVFVSLLGGGEWPQIDFGLIAFITAMAAIAGNGGLSNAPMSNYVRDQGWGMGHHVGAIPSIVGGRGIALSHVGCVFEPNESSLVRWGRWYWKVARDQLLVWMPACFVGLALPSMLSVEFLRRGTQAGDWNAAVMTAQGVRQHVADPPPGVLAYESGLSNILYGQAWGNLFWSLTLLCGFLVLGTTLVSNTDGIVRRWVDVFWTASRRMRAVDPKFIKHVYFTTLLAYGAFVLAMLWLNTPAELIKWGTLGFNLALGFSSWHTLFINTLLLPRELRPGLFPRLALLFGGMFFVLLFVLTLLNQLGMFRPSP
ncbi:MAG: Nramp family divalent metal transporter [Planctomycetaceae bacterium]|nr:Nramp family divalent metal transporter [Planctomycetaceae bacterium]